jgi:cytidylate kinase
MKNDLNKRWIITIDGPAGVGKSTVARMLAERLGAVFLDTGATYRAVTLAAMRAGAELTDTPAVMRVMDDTRFDFVHEGSQLKVFLNGVEATHQIRDPKVTEQVRHIAGAGALRARLVDLQRAFAARFERVVTEGRDQGTVVFPEAKYKFFLTADARQRARRRFEELKAAGQTVEFETLVEQIVSRDASDENRAVGPLKPAADAVKIDTTHIDAAGVVEKMLAVIHQAGYGND